MSSNRPRLLMPIGLVSDRRQIDLLRNAFEIVEVESISEAQQLAQDGDDALLVLLPHPTPAPEQGLPPERLLSILEHVGEGAGLIDAQGELVWSNARLRAYPLPIRQHFATTCARALAQFNQSGLEKVPLNRRPASTFNFSVGESHYEVLVSIASVEPKQEHVVSAVVGIHREVTATRTLQSKIDAVDAAGSELLRIETDSIQRLNVAQRLSLLEEKIVRYVRELLNFDNFEIRLIDRETKRLELVISHGLRPLRIGEVIYAEPEGNGISGYVAATGRSYLCNDVSRDPLYREGLDAAASSLTIPLRLHDQVIGVLNVESGHPNQFSDNDRRFAEIFGRYVAMAMHILDLLVVERYTTNEQATEHVLTELSEPLARVTAVASEMRGQLDGPLRESLEEILKSAESARRCLEMCRGGPRSLLGAEQEMHRERPEPAMLGKRVLLADDEPHVREAISLLLTQKGCCVTTCGGGLETVEKLRASVSEDGSGYHLVISDIRMPDLSGYEVFEAVKELTPSTPVILITGFGYDPNHSIVRASQEGLHSFLFKPLRAGQLLDAVKKALTPA